MPDFIHDATAAALRQIAHNTPAAQVIERFCVALERRLPGTLVGVTILDRVAKLFEQAIFPSLAPSFASALVGIAVEDKPGSCALAIYEGKPVTCENVATDERFSEGWRNLSLEHGIEALVSIPAVHANGLSLGTLVIAFPVDSPLSDADRALADRATEICALILTYRREQIRQDLLVGELQHRIRNLFSSVGAMVLSTLRTHPDPMEFRRVFEGRLRAFSKAHSLALEAHETDLRLLLTDLLAPYTVEHDIELSGPQFLLTQQAALSLSLAAHELATNATKYGSLSSPTGRISIGWQLEPQETGPTRFVLRWQEQGGPRVKAPLAKGYGQKTITHSFAALEGSVELDYQAGGLVCTVSAPLSPVLGSAVN